MIRRTLGGLTAIGAAGLAWGLTEARCFALREVEVPVLPSGQQPIRVLHISDIHLMPYDRRKQDFLRSLEALEPDLVVNTGDNLGSAKAMDTLFDCWGGLLDRPGAFIFGSNDYTEPAFRNPLVYFRGPSSSEGHEAKTPLPFEDLRRRMTDRGWVDLNHRRATLEVAGRRISLRGTDDAHLDKDDYSLVAGPADETADLNIGVTHAPYLRVLDAMTDDGLDLLFAGHTHGGQVCVPLMGALVTNCDIEPDRVKGLSKHHHGTRSSWLHVSGGIGTSPFAPYRVACRPEATLLTLAPK